MSRWITYPFHDRMPVIIAPDNYTEWLDPSVIDVTQLKALTVPYPERLKEAYPVSRAVNTPSNEGWR